MSPFFSSVNDVSIEFWESVITLAATCSSPVPWVTAGTSWSDVKLNSVIIQPVLEKNKKKNSTTYFSPWFALEVAAWWSKHHPMFSNACKWVFICLVSTFNGENHNVNVHERLCFHMRAACVCVCVCRLAQAVCRCVCSDIRSWIRQACPALCSALCAVFPFKSGRLAHVGSLGFSCRQLS